MSADKGLEEHTSQPPVRHMLQVPVSEVDGAVLADIKVIGIGDEGAWLKGAIIRYTCCQEAGAFTIQRQLH